MTVKLLVLFLTPLLAGLMIFLLPPRRTAHYRLLLVFAGSYLFSLTVIHILPELYRKSDGLVLTGLFVLAGFFLQQLLEYFTRGVEHGHLHSKNEHHGVSAILLLSALCIHAFLEGGMLAESPKLAAVYDRHAVLAGIALHRAPAAFALMTVLAVHLHSRRRALPYLLAFSLAAPAGLLISTQLARADILSSAGLLYLYALVSGNFLHISTTIVFESAPGHQLSSRKMVSALLGAMLAVVVEYVL